MNKNVSFLIAMTVVTGMLFKLDTTGMMGHISTTVMGLVIMIPFTLATRKEWKIPAPEVLMRVMYFVAIITGGVMMKIQDVAALNVAHKIAAALFAVLLWVLYIPKCKK